MWLGAAFMTCVAGNDDWQAAYDSAGAGGLMNQAFQGHGPHVNGFGKFVQLVLVLSTIAVTIPNLYSMGLSMQNVGMWAVKVPRFVWTTIGFVIFTVAAIAGREHFASILENFLNCLAYWYTPKRKYSNNRVVPWTTIVCLENWWFRRGGRNPYQLDLWWTQKGLPYGIAALASFACSVVLAIMAMSQVWYVGPIAIAAGGEPYGVDLGWCLALGMSLLTYPPFRYLELKYTGK
jgi:purine-cytosine permease-like protein